MAGRSRISSTETSATLPAAIVPTIENADVRSSFSDRPFALGDPDRDRDEQHAREGRVDIASIVATQRGSSRAGQSPSTSRKTLTASPVVSTSWATLKVSLTERWRRLIGGRACAPDQLREQEPDRRE